MTIKITTDNHGLPGKLAEAEIHFTEGPLAGLKLIGFGIWERRTGGGRNITFPARQYSINGDRRSFALLRPTGDDVNATTAIREAILAAYVDFEQACETEGHQPGTVNVCGTCGGAHETAACPHRFGGKNYDHASTPDGV